MAPNSVDDMYAGCKDKMEQKVKTEFLLNERNKNKNYSLAWNEAEKYYNKKWNRKHGKKQFGTLGKEQIMAIYMYTLDKPAIYAEFNEAVRTQRSQYKSTFGYHTLHFFLSSALQALNSLKPQAQRCITGFRRVNKYFSQDVLNKEVRFGSFTSSSMGWYPRPDKFGDKTCYEIYTCFGADISLYSKLGESEREVLIPPYEVFKVTKLERQSEKKNLKCDFVYKVKSTRTLSNSNCAFF
ncbi:erythroblast NAD(P)(+)--arginine ADP-ribosyltransferase-like [Cololabis saira]|uniref:erythroblast NAD(P)(+)--arginine ADP-ribosyltransferase-like n=1 Tax=Cololabis saira TaxID=129043 RepID=UPI002AD3E53E|nr:erythroblast NAD(P)(+)--arginine ADP-ribosyltransferase-like [Cololabis saira]